MVHGRPSMMLGAGESPTPFVDTISLRDDHPSSKAGKQAASERATTKRRSERAACLPSPSPLPHLRGMALSCKRPTRWAPGAVLTVDFLLRQSQNPAKSHLEARSIILQGPGSAAAQLTRRVRATPVRSRPEPSAPPYWADC